MEGPRWLPLEANPEVTNQYEAFDKMHFESGSTLKKFLEESVSMSPEERARYLENYDAIRVTRDQCP
ncbi:Ubiquitin Carboxyl-Terminal Hydrolase Isozyme L3 [Manis pentadactyla]|nr:Ubiquitin Carboxyl-Terminal Hydrolase Isozyme L3 [Manis pentadactyla]